jgi:hypothetical protein
VGGRGLLRGAASVGDEGLGLDIDTEEDVERARGLLGSVGWGAYGWGGGGSHPPGTFGGKVFRGGGLGVDLWQSG